MEAGRKYKHYENTRINYIEGNTVRKLETAPVYEEDELGRKVSSPRRNERRQTKTLSGINLTSLLVLCAAIIATLFVCVDYLKLQADVTQMNKQIIVKQQELTVLTKKNDAEYDKINAACDLDKIYRIAVKELGMVYPNKNTVITYKSSDDDYVRQYENIPSN
jgi:Septum formation initiator.